MVVKYLFHSGFLVELEKAILIFDYYRRGIPEDIFDKNKDIYFFVSHCHADHFNPEIFRYLNSNVYYILSYDISKKGLHMDTINSIEGLMYEFMNPNIGITLQGMNGSALYIETLKSTDKGVAYLVTCEGKSIYHAGDHNDWRIEGAEKAKNNNVKALYERELNNIKGRHVDVAFLPLDYRQGEYYSEGMKTFLKATDTDYVFPMHMWEKYEYIEVLRNSDEFYPFKDKIVDVNEDGKQWNI